MTKNMKEFFLNEKPCSLIVSIRRRNEPYASELAKAIDTTYAHTVKVIQKMEDEGIVDSRKKGRKKFLSLTEGTEIAKVLNELYNFIEGNSLDNDSNGESVESDLEIKL